MSGSLSPLNLPCPMVRESASGIRVCSAWSLPGGWRSGLGIQGYRSLPCIHGNETAPIEICNQLLSRLLAGELSARHRVLFPFGNPAAMNLGLREVEENTNRLFSGAHSKGEGLCNRERIRAMRSSSM